MFNDGGYWERAENGEYNVIVRRRGIPAPESGQPPNTESQTVVYYDKRTGDKIAIVHQFVLEDGTLGGSGMPDPKQLYHDGVLYAASRFV